MLTSFLRKCLGILLSAFPFVLNAQTAFGPGALRGVWANARTEVVVTDSVMMYFSYGEDTKSGIALLKAPTRDIDRCTVFAPDTIYKQAPRRCDFSRTDSATLTVNGETLYKVEDIRPVQPYDMAQATERSQIGVRLQEWQLGTCISGRGEEDVNVTIGTNANSFIYCIEKGMVYLRAAALLQCNEGSLFVQNIRMMKNPNTNEQSCHRFENHQYFLTHLPPIDRSKFDPDRCVFGEEWRIYWSYKSHTPDEILINGCGETYHVPRPQKNGDYLSEWFEYVPREPRYE